MLLVVVLWGILCMYLFCFCLQQSRVMADVHLYLLAWLIALALEMLGGSGCTWVLENTCRGGQGLLENSSIVLTIGNDSRF